MGRMEGAMEIKGVSVVAFVFRQQANTVQFLMLKRSKERGGFWQPVSGTIKGRETAAQAAMREVEEETGLRLRRYVVADAVNVFYKEAEDTIYVEPVFGIEVADGKVTLSPEHILYRWCSPEDAMGLLPFEGNRVALRAVCRAIGVPVEVGAREGERTGTGGPATAGGGKR
ncbi:MAG: NUDIX pyrophosphatase [Planctomycetota bacterium]|nr:NUDIX pyrophosphatase [Planctomycetota bacterium]